MWFLEPRAARILLVAENSALRRFLLLTMISEVDFLSGIAGGHGLGRGTGCGNG